MKYLQCNRYSRNNSIPCNEFLSFSFRLLFTSVFFFLLVLGNTNIANAQKLLQVKGSITPASNPQIIKQNGVYYMFTHSGNGPAVEVSPGKKGNVWIRSSTNLKFWKDQGTVFTTPIAWWTADSSRDFTAIWAPSINYFNGKYHLYYSLYADHIKKQNSAIALVTNKTLDPKDPEYQWIDEGIIYENVRYIDPNLVWDASSPAKPYLICGSWTPIILQPLDALTGKLESIQPHPVPVIAGINPQNYEAAFIFQKHGWYYLLVAADAGYDSDKYVERIGRSRNFDGPYLDKEGKDMKNGGGTIFSRFTTIDSIEYHAVAHGSIFTDTDGKDYWVTNYYAGTKDSPGGKGARVLVIGTIKWDKDEWPINALTPPFK